MQNLQNNETNSVSKEARGKRVREERKRLGYTQQDIADICGVHRVQWGRYERGEQGLDGEPLKKFGDAGASISYVLTGQRLQGNAGLVGRVVSNEDKYTKEETILVSLFRKMNKDKKALLVQTARAFVDKD